MATLFNTKISATYEGLLKTIDNAAITATLRELTDGSGNQSGLYLNTAGDFKVTAILEWGSLKDTGTGVTITQFVTAANGIENFDNDTTIPTSAAVKLYVDTKFSQTDTLQEVLGFGNTTSGTDIAVSAGDDITFTDSSKIILGTSSEFEIFQDTADSRITTLSNLYIQTPQFRLQKVGGEQMITAISDAQVELYYNNSKRLETTLLGTTVTGDLLVTGTITASGGTFLPLAGGTMTGDIVLNDNVKSIYGTASDGLEIYHDGSHSYLKDSGTGDLKISSNTVRIESDGAENMIIASANGAVNLYYNNNQKLATTGAGVTVTGGITTATGNFSDNVYLSVGQLYLGASGTSTDDSYRMYATSGQFVLASRESGTWTTRFDIDTSGNATFENNVEIKGNLTVDGQIIHGGSSGTGGGTFTGTKGVTSTSSIAFTLKRAVTGTLIFDVYMQLENSVNGSVAKKYTVAHSHNTTPVYNKIIDTGPDSSNDFSVVFSNATGDAAGDSVTCNVTSTAAADLSYTVMVGYDHTRILTFTAG